MTVTRTNDCNNCKGIGCPQCVDPRARQLAEARQHIAHRGIGYLPAWEELTDDEREQSTREASKWVRAAVEAGLMPLADDSLAAEVDRLRSEVDKLNSSEWKMDPWMQDRFRKRARQWGEACCIVEVAQDRKDPYLDIDEMAEALGLNDDDAKGKPADEEDEEVTA